MALKLGIRVRSAGECAPIKDAVVDIWHCDAGGVYSGLRGGGEGARFLRGTQVTNAEGIAEFTTIYPGWYRGRTVHIHAKVHLDKQTVLTTQLFFDEAVTEQVYARTPYSPQRPRHVQRPGRDLRRRAGDDRPRGRRRLPRADDFDVRAAACAASASTSPCVIHDPPTQATLGCAR